MTGLTKNSISAYELHQFEPGLDALARIARALGVTMDELVMRVTLKEIYEDEYHQITLEEGGLELPS